MFLQPLATVHHLCSQQNIVCRLLEAHAIYTSNKQFDITLCSKVLVVIDEVSIS